MTEMLICGNGPRSAALEALLERIRNTYCEGVAEDDEDSRDRANDMGIVAAWSLYVVCEDDAVAAIDAACEADPAVVYCGSPYVANGAKATASGGTIWPAPTTPPAHALNIPLLPGFPDGKPTTLMQIMTVLAVHHIGGESIAVDVGTADGTVMIKRVPVVFFVGQLKVGDQVPVTLSLS